MATLSGAEVSVSRTVELTNPITGATVTVGGRQVTLMGVINRSPESSNRDVYAASPHDALVLANRFAEAGVTVIDLGGQSTNYENPEIGIELELERLLPTVRVLAAAGHIVSVDTWKPEVAERCIEEGAALINDTGGLQDDRMVDVVAAAGVPCVLMHLEGEQPLEVGAYESRAGKPARIAAWMRDRLAELESGAVSQVIIDPGVAISYRTDYDAYSKAQFEVAERLDELVAVGRPVLYAVPRKEARYRNVSLAALAMAAGAAMLRIHDVDEIADVAWLMRRLDRKPGEAGAA
jgi:dihydropteroate synthase